MICGFYHLSAHLGSGRGQPAQRGGGAHRRATAVLEPAVLGDGALDDLRHLGTSVGSAWITSAVRPNARAKAASIGHQRSARLYRQQVEHRHYRRGRRRPIRFTELERRIEGISRRMLTVDLRKLERDGLLVRTVYPTVPPKVEYSLTPIAGELGDSFAVLTAWAERHRHAIAVARRKYDG
jgi:DNA-binding HxlR family transcriptional regulator